MSASTKSGTPYYFVPQPSKWPMFGAIALLLFGVSMGGWVNGAAWGGWLFAAFLIVFAYTLVGWFGDAARESESGLYSQRVDSSYRWSMGWFIFSEVMFFSAFFGALYYARSVTLPWLGDQDQFHLLILVLINPWPGFYPSKGMAITAKMPFHGIDGCLYVFQLVGLSGPDPDQRLEFFILAQIIACEGHAGNHITGTFRDMHDHAHVSLSGAMVV